MGGPGAADTEYAPGGKRIQQRSPGRGGVNADVAESLPRVIRKATVREPAARYQAAAEMHDALEAIG